MLTLKGMMGTMYTYCIHFNTSCCKIDVEILGIYLFRDVLFKEVSLQTALYLKKIFQISDDRFNHVKNIKSIFILQCVLLYIVLVHFRSKYQLTCVEVVHCEYKLYGVLSPH